MKGSIALLCSVAAAGALLVSCGSGSSESAAEKSLTGSWTSDKFDMTIEDDGDILARSDMGSSVFGGSMQFNEDGSLTFQGRECGSDTFDYDGETYVLHAFSDNDLTLRRLEPNDGSVFYGKYILEESATYDAIAKGYNKRSSETGGEDTFDGSDINIYFDISAEGLSALAEVPFGKVNDDETVTIYDKDVPYALDGDTLTLSAAAGEMKFTRIRD